MTVIVRGGTGGAVVGLAVVSIGPAFQCTEYGYGSELRSSGVLRALCWGCAGDGALLRSLGSVISWRSAVRDLCCSYTHALPGS